MTHADLYKKGRNRGIIGLSTMIFTLLIFPIGWITNSSHWSTDPPRGRFFLNSDLDGFEMGVSNVHLTPPEIARDPASHEYNKRAVRKYVVSVLGISLSHDVVTHVNGEQEIIDADVTIYAISLVWIIALGISGSLLFVFRMFWYGKLARRLQAGKCIRCSYDLRVTPNRCPECGFVYRE